MMAEFQENPQLRIGITGVSQTTRRLVGVRVPARGRVAGAYPGRLGMAGTPGQPSKACKL